eukprot:COSAG06_NODE_8003_length_2306_cov_1.574082_1_plen_73_part_10
MAQKICVFLPKVGVDVVGPVAERAEELEARLNLVVAPRGAAALSGAVDREAAHALRREILQQPGECYVDRRRD